MSSDIGLELTRPRPGPGTVMYSIVGPTAVGKTAVATAVAPRLEAEIVSVDSMQVYRGMDIGTSKPGTEDRSAAAYHLLDVAGPDEHFSAAKYKELADAAIVGITGRGSVPLLVGGTGLYYRALVDDLDFSNAGERLYSVEMHEELEEMDDRQLHELLLELDPEAADQIPDANRRRALRAIEVARSGDRLISKRQHAWGDFESPYQLVATGLEMDRGLLNRRIDARVDAMFEAGLVEEVRALKAEGLAKGSTSGEALGYKQVLEALDGLISMDAAVEEIKKKTRNYAKRQMTWFGKDPRIKWFKVHGHEDDPPDKVRKSLAATSDLVFEYLASRTEG